MLLRSQLTEEDLDQVTSGNFVTKVVYLPDPEYQELAVAGVDARFDGHVVRLEVPADRLKANYPILVRSLSNIALSYTPGEAVWFTTMERGDYAELLLTAAAVSLP